MSFFKCNNAFNFKASFSLHRNCVAISIILIVQWKMCCLMKNSRGFHLTAGDLKLLFYDKKFYEKTMIYKIRCKIHLDILKNTITIYTIPREIAHILSRAVASETLSKYWICQYRYILIKHSPSISTKEETLPFARLNRSLRQSIKMELSLLIVCSRTRKFKARGHYSYTQYIFSLADAIFARDK